jgi:hypothetical protein
MSEAPTVKSRRHGCRLCGRPTSADHAPFCSQGCRDRDLLNWLGDGYRVAGPPADEMLDSDGEPPL